MVYLCAWEDQWQDGGGGPVQKGVGTWIPKRGVGVVPRSGKVVCLSGRVWYLTLRWLRERGCPTLLYGEGFTSSSMMCAGRPVTEILRIRGVKRYFRQGSFCPALTLINPVRNNN